MVLALILSAGLLAQPAAAQPAGFQSTYTKGVKLEKNGQIVDALVAFESIPLEKRDFNTRLHIAGCKEKLNRLLAARDDYEALRTDPKADGPTVDTAAAALTDLDSRIPVIRLTVSAKDIVVRLDDKEVKAGDVRVDPGPHSIVAKRGEATVFERKLDVEIGSKVAVTVDVPAAPMPAAPVPQPAPPAPASESPPSRITGLPFYIGGGLALAAAGGALLLASSANHSVEENCREQIAFDCDEEAAGAARVRSWRTVSIVSASLAVVAIGVGIGIDATRPSKQGASLRLNIATTPTSTGLQLVGRF